MTETRQGRGDGDERWTTEAEMKYERMLSHGRRERGREEKE